MSTLSAITKGNRRKRKIMRYLPIRKELKMIIKSKTATPEERQIAWWTLESLPSDSIPTKFVNRCNITGRPRGVHRLLGICGTMVREFVASGFLPGVTKSSW